VKGKADVFYILYAKVRGEFLDKRDSVSRDLLSMGQQTANIILYSRITCKIGSSLFGIPSDGPCCTNENNVSPDEKIVGLRPFWVDIQSNPP
jgi:hypothetical protein